MSDSPFPSVGMVAGGPDQAGALLAQNGAPSADPSESEIPMMAGPQRSIQPDMASGVSTPPMPINPHRAEFERLTKPPLDSGTNASAHTSADTGRSGIEQIHNPWLRGLATAGDVIASGVFPRFGQFVPGTSAHHQLLVNQNENAQGAENANAKSDAEVARTGAQSGLENAQAEAIPSETELRRAQAKEADARAEEILNPVKAMNPKDKYLVVGDGVFDASKGEFIPGHEPTDKKLAEVTEIDPVKGKSLGLTPNKDGKYIVPNAALGGLLRPQAEKTISPEQQFIDEYRTKTKPGASIAEAEKAYKDLTPKERADHGVTMIDPKTHQLIRIEPGQSVPEGALTAQQSGAQNAPTQQQRNVAGQAQLVHEQMPEVIQNIDKLKDKLGPIAGRWNDFMQGKVGTDNPDFASLRADLLMMSSAVALMHARGRLPENLREEFDHAINAPKQTPENLKAVLNKIDQWTTKSMELGGKKPNDAALPGGVTIEDIDKELARRKSGK